MALDSSQERIFLAVAHALFMNRLHLLRLTEVVRLGIKPDPVDGSMQLPPELDEELGQQAMNFVLAFMPSELTIALNHAKADWLRPA